MKRALTPVAIEIFTTLAAKHAGLVVEEKAGWLKLQGPTGLRIYVARQKFVRAVHLSGFGAGMPGTVPPAPNGRVQAELDLTASFEDICTAFDAACAHASSGASAPPARRPSGAGAALVAAWRKEHPVAARGKAAAAASKGKKAAASSPSRFVSKTSSRKRAEEARAQKAADAEARRLAREAAIEADARKARAEEAVLAEAAELETAVRFGGAHSF